MECQAFFKRRKKNKCNRYNCKLHAPTQIQMAKKKTPVPVSEYNIHLLNTSKQNKDEITRK
jgi:hypothetical protein